MIDTLPVGNFEPSQHETELGRFGRNNPLGRCIIGTATSPGTFGEILQGTRSDGVAFLVTLPIHKYAKASYARPALLDRCEPLSVKPVTKTKSLNIARRLLAMHGCRQVGLLHIESEIPHGKGLASSTADLVATVRAIEASLSLEPLSPEQVAVLLCEVEPSDGLMYQNSVVFAHRVGRLIHRLPPVVGMDIVAIDEGGEVDTQAFNRSAHPPDPSSLEQYDALLQRLVQAFEAQNLHEIGQIATISAELNQAILPKRWLAACRHIAERWQALGVVVAHSGTCIGILFERGRSSVSEQKQAGAIRDLESLGLSPWLESTIGGVKLGRSNNNLWPRGA